MTEPIKVMRPSDREPGTTLDALPTNMRAGSEVTVTVCAEPDARPFGRPCRVVLDARGACARHGQPNDPQRVTVPAAWDVEGNRTMTHPMWRGTP